MHPGLFQVSGVFRGTCAPETYGSMESFVGVALLQDRAVMCAALRVRQSSRAVLPW